MNSICSMVVCLSIETDKAARNLQTKAKILKGEEVGLLSKFYKIEKKNNLKDENENWQKLKA